MCRNKIQWQAHKTEAQHAMTMNIHKITISSCAGSWIWTKFTTSIKATICNKTHKKVLKYSHVKHDKQVYTTVHKNQDTTFWNWQWHLSTECNLKIMHTYVPSQSYINQWIHLFREQNKWKKTRPEDTTERNRRQKNILWYRQDRMWW